MNLPKLSWDKLKGRTGLFVLAGGATLGLLIVRPWRRSVAASEAAAATLPVDPLSASGNALGPTYTGGITGAPSSATDSSTSQYATNAQWRRVMAGWLSTTMGVDPLAADDAVARYLAGRPLSVQQKAWLNQAIAANGLPPYAVDVADDDFSVDDTVESVVDKPTGDGPPTVSVGFEPPPPSVLDRLRPSSPPIVTPGAVSASSPIVAAQGPAATEAPVTALAGTATTKPAPSLGGAAETNTQTYRPPSPPPATPETPPATSTPQPITPGTSVVDIPGQGITFVDPSWQGGYVNGTFVPANNYS